LLDGTVSMALNMSGAASTNLSGSALAVFDTSAGCDDSGKFAKIKEIIYGKKWWDGLVDLAIASTNAGIKTNDIITVYGLYKGGSTSLVRPENLTFVGATVGANGVVSAVSATTITAIVADSTAPDNIKAIQAMAKGVTS
ncbi:MAG: hypothetical protein ACRDD8_03870, partial [Bacteroidales bacterium]